MDKVCGGCESYKFDLLNDKMVYMCIETCSPYLLVEIRDTQQSCEWYEEDLLKVLDMVMK